MTKIKGIIFDIGGVLLDDPEFKDFWQGKEESKKLRYLFGIGEMSTETLIDKGSKLLKMSNTEFLDGYNKAYSSMNMIDDVCDVYNNVTVNKYIFSDTNPIHYGHCKRKFPSIFANAKRLFLSFEIHHRKSDIKSYEYLLKNIPYKPEELIFIDNKEKYIKQAIELGLNGITYINGMDLSREIEKVMIY